MYYLLKWVLMCQSGCLCMEEHLECSRSFQYVFLYKSGCYTCAQDIEISSQLFYCLLLLFVIKVVFELKLEPKF